ncbi:efflux RND transporter periplasmic adaptor subunit [Rhodoblastus acidophilus]|uniref:Efflux RND transporter periplasmic adaptor subunit n=1 Tax=Candidatus Rhodoblastus alkanivorans TaxID=2954117 RepID=A0ABS9Z8F2_9HYPH|nr:efflux RND transporter periplasmic adaptor subunit [Candidatus Rhodoblastus alkanivorans]MCI4678727.1 efflux RND transporter periplasmic adaptor subunit [Candidatus Rhodoblastus alkanivorans]MCI4683477.1 efflux RND transporter periplasmic adaptor subunit [Candidatus Rhodoblastus alkanivorans]MDI4640791.1 efflux RND transporter periplasmic adaptor subunit [Rhodoblastus acidophilus]
MSQISWIPVFSAALAAAAAYGLAARVQCAANAGAVAQAGGEKRKGAASASAQKPRRGLFLVGALLAAALAYVAVERALTPASEEALNVAPAATPVRIADAVATQWPTSVTIPGNVSAVDTANIASRSGGLVTRVLVDAGAQVTKGQLLAEVGTADAHAQIAQAQARVDTAQAVLKQVSAEYDRYNTLHEKQFASTAQFQQAERQYLAARAELDAADRGLSAAQTDIGYAEIRAPFDGIVAQKSVWPGDYANPGTTLFVVASATPEIRASAGPATFAALKVGDAAVVRVNGQDLPAKVTSLVDAADPQTRTHLVKLWLDRGAAAPFGSYAEVRFNLGQTPALSVPEAALTERAGLVGVFVVGKDDHAHLRLVRAGAHAGGQVAIMAGLKAGDRVILSPPADLENGSPVSPQTAVKAATEGNNG